MKLTFVGSGSAFTLGEGNYQSNLLLENSSKERLLIDCGGDIRFGLYDLGLTALDIQAIFVSHLHTDHTGGLEWLAFNNYFAKEPRKPILYISELLEKDLWDHVLSGGLSSLDDKQAKLSTYFQVKRILLHKTFIWSKIKFTLVKTHHTQSKGKENPSFGLFFKVNKKAIFITADTQYTPEMLDPYYRQADLIFHDCETLAHPSGVHTNFKELKTLDPAIKNKMWLYHYNPGKRPEAEKHGFLGYVRRGQSFDLNSL